MGCNCKNQPEQYSVASDVKLNKKIINYTFRSIVFLFSLILLPIILIASIWFMFRTLVLNKDVNIYAIISAINDKIKSKSNKEDDDDEDYYLEEDYDESDYELIDVDNIGDKIN